MNVKPKSLPPGKFYLLATKHWCILWVGGELIEAEPGYVWLTNRAGKQQLKIPAADVREISEAELDHAVIKYRLSNPQNN